MKGFIDINRGKVRKAVYKTVQTVSNITSGLAGGTLVVAQAVDQFTELGATFPAETVSGISAAVAFAALLNGWVMKVSAERVVDEIDGVLAYLDSTPE